MIEKIQLRGISRSPSDRMTADGGCSESYNVITDQQEIAPIPTPTEMSDELGIPAGEACEVLYVHKGNGYSNAIVKKGNAVGYYGTPSELGIPESLKNCYWALPDMGIASGVEEVQGMGGYKYAVVLYNDATQDWGGGPPDYVLGSYEKGDYYVPATNHGANQETQGWYLEQVSAGYDTNGFVKLFDLGEGGEVSDINAIGNTLIVSAGDSLHYILYRDEAYEYLGTQIPIPHLAFISKYASLVADDDTTRTYVNQFDNARAQFKTFDTDNKNAEILSESYKISAEADQEMVTQALEVARNTRSLAIVNHVDARGLLQPRFIRYAVRLYDGRHINISSPIMVGPLTWRDRCKFYVHTYIQALRSGSSSSGSSSSSDDSRTDGTSSSIQESYTILRVNRKDGYYVQMSRQGDLHIFDKWKDIVSGIDVFATVPTSFYQSEDTAGIANVSKTTTTTTNGSNTYVITEQDAELILDPANAWREKEIVLSQTDYRLVRRYSVDEYAALTTSPTTIDNIRLGAEKLATQESLSDSDYRSQHLYYGGKLLAYNNRVIVSDLRRKLPTGYDFIQGATWRYFSQDAKETPDFYRYLFHIRGQNGEKLHIEADNASGGREMESISSSITYYPTNTSTATRTVQTAPYSWISYPDSRCYAVDVVARVYDNVTRAYKEYRRNNIPMEVSSTGDFAYYLNPKQNLLDYIMASSDTDPQTAENSIESLPNYFVQSEASNPFLFLPSGVQSFSSKIMGIATTTKALSQGQFGQYPLYIFTEGGIWAMETASDGSLSTKKPLSRDVALSADCITPIEQAIVFTTDQGVMLLTGSDIRNISPYMLGKHYTMDSASQAMIDRSSLFSGLITPDTTPFMEFMRTAKCAYDYTGQRLIFLNGGKDYLYIYKTDTNTWHKSKGTESDRMFDVRITAVSNASLIPALPDEQSTVAEHQSYREFIITVLETLKNCDAPQMHLDLLKLGNGDIDSILYKRTDQADAEGYSDCIEEFAFQDKVTLTGAKSNAVFVPKALNSYPDCHIAIGPKVYNYSATLETDGAAPMRGIIVTRPFDCGQPDIRKVIRSIRIRGFFNRQDVKYILQGSMDGIYWGILPSLRSGSFKLFRLILLADLSKDERISWIDVDYETRFTNRLR